MALDSLAHGAAAPSGRTARGAPIKQGLMRARITHVRYTPKPYALAHRLTYLHIPLSALTDLPRRFLARNGFGLFALNDKDYGQGRTDLAHWVREALASEGVAVPHGEVTLVTLPRVLGFGFNPVSFWLCHDAAGALRVVLAEVNNTFGERHCYLCSKPDGSTISPDEEIVARKVFHVSPFMPVEGQYRFRFIEKPGRLSIRIDLHRDGRRTLSATICGELTDLTSNALFKSFLRHPFPTLQVVLLIHYHAARLYMAGHKLFSKPAAPDHLITSSLPPSPTVKISEPT